jgi:hypothetical protein
MFPLDFDPSINKAMVSYRQEQVRASFPRKITRWLAPEPRRAAPAVSATATPRLAEQVVPEPRLAQPEEKYVA